VRLNQGIVDVLAKMTLNLRDLLMFNLLANFVRKLRIACLSILQLI